MKKTLCIFTVLATIISCTTDQTTSEINNDTQTVLAQKEAKTHNENTRIIGQNINSSTEITVTTTSVGYDRKITLKGTRVTKAGTEFNPTVSYNLSTTKFNQINKIFNELRIDLIPYYSVPTYGFTYDGVRNERLIVIHNGITYASKSYDENSTNVVLKKITTAIKSL